MSDVSGRHSAGPFGGAPQPLWERIFGSRRFQAWAARMPGLRRIVRAEGAAIFDLMQGFVKSQALMALVDLRVLEALRLRPQSAVELAHRMNVAPERMLILLQAGAAMGLLRRKAEARFGLSPRGLSFLTVPGLAGMVQHHRVLYADLADPVAFLRGDTQPALADFWPYVFGAGAARDPVAAATYSELMTDSQALVAEDVLQKLNLSGVRHLMDVGGGTGAFLSAAGRAHPGLALSLFDLPAVLEGARARLDPALGVRLCPGSFRDDALPQGADAISLVRVLYDHQDDTVAALLAKVYKVLPSGGRVIVAEPMSGGARPDRITDVYFAFYTLAMQTGRTRSMAEIGDLLAAAGFVGVTRNAGYRPYVASLVSARRA